MGNIATAITTGATKILRSRTFWIVLGIVVILLIIRKYWSVIADRLKPLKGDFSDKVTGDREKYLELLADELSEKINGNYVFEDREETLLKILSVNDSELLHLYRYYNRYHNNMIDDIENEWLPFTDSDEKIISRLNGMGLS